MNRLVLFVAVMMAFATVDARATTVTFGGNGNSQPGGSFETMISAAYPMSGGYLYGSPNLNFGGSSWIGAREGGSTRSLLRFDLAALDGRIQSITSVTLRLFQDGRGYVNQSAMDLYLVNSGANSNWQEGSDTGSYVGGGGAWCRTTWGYVQRGGTAAHAWDGSTGGNYYGTQGIPPFDTFFSPTLATGVMTPGVANQPVDLVFNASQYAGGLTQLIKDWATDRVTDFGNGAFATIGVNEPTINTGMILTSSGSGARFYSSEYGTASLGPQLIIEGTFLDPAVNVKGNGVSIVDGDSTPSPGDFTDFGTVAPTSFFDRLFLVENTGQATLTTSTLTVPTGYSIWEGLSASILPGQSDTFTVRLNKDLNLPIGTTYDGDISFKTNDPNIATYNFKVTGNINVTAIPEPTALVALGLLGLIRRRK